jgi:hypothetical protein
VTILVRLIYLIREMKYVRKYDFLLSQVSMANHGLPKLKIIKERRFLQEHRYKMIYYWTCICI